MMLLLAPALFDTAAAIDGPTTGLVRITCSASGGACFDRHHHAWTSPSKLRLADCSAGNPTLRDIAWEFNSTDGSLRSACTDASCADLQCVGHLANNGTVLGMVGCTAAALQLSLDGQRIKSSGGLCLGVDGCDYTARDSAFVLQACGTGGGCGGANQLWAVAPYHPPPAPPPPPPPPPPAPPNPVCAGTASPHTAADCSLNGKVTGRKCVCDPPWAGLCCGTIETRPASPGGVYGYAPDNCTFIPKFDPNGTSFPCSSWGGNSLKGDDGQYHLIVAQFKFGRHMDNESECVHAVSKTIAGPYTKLDVAVPDTCHNPATLRDPKTGEWLIFHIGFGNPIGDCGSPGGCAGHASSKLNPGNGFLHTAKTPSGPWTPLNLTHPSTWGSCNNPAPAFHPNGSLFVICNHMQITHASDWDAGDWTPQRSMGQTPAGTGGWEDPTLWFD